MISRLATALSTAARRVRSLQAGWQDRRRPPPFAAVSAVPVARHDLNLTAYAADFRQPDQVSCGASSLVFSRMVHDRAYAARIIAVDDAARRTLRWNAEVRSMHRQVSGLRDHDGVPQWPWLRIVGTSPWGAARQMQGGAGRSGLAHSRYGVCTLNPDELGTEFDRITATVQAGHTVPLYVGTDARPAHVVLVLSSDADRLNVYEPHRGRIVRLGRDEFATGTFDLGGWSVPWFTVLPR